jgi:hypothetical protein
MTIRIDGTNTAANPGITGTDTDTGLQFGTDEVSIVTGGTEQLKVESDGRLLVGTSSESGSSTVVVRGRPGVSAAEGQLELGRNQPATTPFGSGDPLGKILFTDNGSNVYSQIVCEADGTSASGDYPGRLVFSTTADGASSPTERMRLTSSGDGHLLIGTTDGSSGGGVGVKLKAGGGASLDVVTNAASNIDLNHVYNENATRNGYRYYLSVDGGIRNFSGSNVNLSDEREKKNIVDMDSTWSDLKRWTLRQFHFNDQDDSEDKCYGVIAQQIETVSPQVLSTFETNPTTTRKGVKEQKMVWMAIKTLQEAMDRIETLETQNASLEARLTALEGGAE